VPVLKRRNEQPPAESLWFCKGMKGDVMRIDFLADHRHLIPIIAGFMHDEWNDFAPLDEFGGHDIKILTIKV